MAQKATVVIERDDDGYYAYCAELDGCQTQGDTIEEVLQNIKEAIALYVSTLTEAEKQNGTATDSWRKGVRLGYPKLRVAGQRLVELGVRFHDATRLFENASEELYVDSCHFNDRGLSILGEAIARELLRAMESASEGDPAHR